MDLEKIATEHSIMNLLLYCAFGLILCGVLFDVLNLIISKLVPKKTEDINATEVNDSDDPKDSGNVTIPKQELQRMKRELYELKSATNATLDILKDNVR